MKTERLLGIFDFKYTLNAKAQACLSVLFRYEIIDFQEIVGGPPIPKIIGVREEWREVTEEGCFPKYRIT